MPPPALSHVPRGHGQIHKGFSFLPPPPGKQGANLCSQYWKCQEQVGFCHVPLAQALLHLHTVQAHVQAPDPWHAVHWPLHTEDLGILGLTEWESTDGCVIIALFFPVWIYS